MQAFAFLQLLQAKANTYGDCYRYQKYWCLLMQYTLIILVLMPYFFISCYLLYKEISFSSKGQDATSLHLDIRIYQHNQEIFCYLLQRVQTTCGVKKILAIFAKYCAVNHCLKGNLPDLEPC